MLEKKDKMEETEFEENSDVCESSDTKNSAEEKANSELEETKARFLRLAAEYENFRKRTEKEKGHIYSRAYSECITEILPLLDDIDAAFEYMDDEKGKTLLKNRLNETFKKLGLESFGKVGEEFDPGIHNAVSHIENESGHENCVLSVFQKGYKLAEKVIRHASVQVEN
jgi:molecular chaperone GrpE